MRAHRPRRATIGLLSLGIVVWAAGAVFAHDSAHTSRGLSEAARLAGPAPAGTGQVQSRAGWFHIIYGDLPSASGGGAVSGYLLIDDQGQASELLVDEQTLRALGGARAINQQRVVVAGQHAVVPVPGIQAALPLIVVRTLQLETPPPAGAVAPPVQGVSGPQPWATILCQFADWAGVAPNSPSFFESLVLGPTAPSLDHFWREHSYNNVNLAGSAVYGWYVLPKPRSYYVYGSPLHLDFARAASDCTAVADADVTFPNFVGINLMFNADLDNFAWGGSYTLVLDGVGKTYRMTWVPPWGYQNQGPIAHEMGHGFGLPHSSGPYAATYDSRWDVMSDIWDSCPPWDPTYRCVGVGTIAYHKDILGWIPGGQKYVAAPGTSQTILMERLDQPTTANFLMAQLPIGGSSTRFYTVEVRRFAGYDVKLPGEAVVLHRVDMTRSDRDAQVVDSDGNGNPNDAGATWLPGETFVDPANGFTVAVNAQIGNGFLVTITNGTAEPTATLTVAKAGTGSGTVTSSDGTIDCGPACSTTVATGTAITLTAAPAAGSSFAGWSGCTTASGTLCIVTMTATTTVTATFALGTTFVDVPVGHPFLAWIEALVKAGVTAGCSTSPPLYCPDAGVTRNQMAVFVLRGIHGAGYVPPAAGGAFIDVPVTDVFVAWIEQLAHEGITGGCSASPPQYCPNAGVTRAEMAVFLLRARHGAGYAPPAASGRFGDVPLGYWASAWIEQLASEGITSGCGSVTFCPDQVVTRGEMAVFLVKTFGLPL